jgi:hypothetical protein
MNKGWKPAHKGHLRVEDLRTGKSDEIPTGWNSMIIQKCAPYTLHGYDLTKFPEGKYRTSIATYAYEEHITHLEKPRTTDWFVGADQSKLKRALGRNIKHLIRIKHMMSGSGTSKNK